MKRKITAVLLCIALLLTLSVNVSAEASLTEGQLLDQTVVEIGESEQSTRSQTSGIISGAIYKIKNVASGKYMNVDGGTDADGTNIYQKTGDSSIAQKFKVVYSSSSDSYLLYAMCSSNGTARVADIYDTGGNLVNGANIKLHTSNEPPSQQVQIISVSTGKYRIAMKKDNSFVFAAYGTSNGSASGTTSTSAGNIYLATYTGATSQQWEFELLENPNASSTPTGFLDRVTSTQIGGWAYQANLPNTALQVHIYIINNSTGEQKIIGTTAGGYRADLASAGYGNGYHAFSYAINWKTYKPGTYTVRAYAIGVNSSNPQLSNSPKTFTVRSSTGEVEEVSLFGINGWAWKPDAPNSAIDVHVYIYNSDGTQVAFYAVTADQLRPDLLEAGYGDGDHGFSISVDWSEFPKDRYRVVAYAVDGSGYNPSFYSGYYDTRKPIYLIGVTDENGIDFSPIAWNSNMTTYCNNIGCSDIVRLEKSNNSNDIYSYTNAIKNSSYCLISTHGGKYSIEWSMRCDYEDLNDPAAHGWYSTTTLKNAGSTQFSGTKCVLLLACSTAEGGETDETNFANVLHSKGVKTVVGFEDTITFFYYEDTMTTALDEGSEKWGIVFTEQLGLGATVYAAAATATRETKDQLTNNTFGLDSYCVIGEKNQVVKY